MSSWRDLIPAKQEARQRAPLALGVELRRRAAYDPAHWGPRAVEAVTPRILASDQNGLFLAARPLVAGAEGSWIKGDSSWDSVRRTPDRYDAAQARWFAELYGIAHDARPTGPFASVSEWLVLDDVASRLLWRHLASARASGIPIVPTRRFQTVDLAGEAKLSVELSATGTGGLRAQARLEIDGESADPARARPIGRSGLYVFGLDRDPLPVTLAPVDLGEGVVALLRSGTVDVPAREREAFLEQAFPHLARETRVVARGLELPDVARPSLVVTADFGGDDEAAYRLEWSYAGLAPIAYARAAAPGDRVRDGAAENSLARRVEEQWRLAASFPFAPEGLLRGEAALDLSLSVLPTLGAIDGVLIVTTGERPVARELRGDPHIRITTVESADPDWFDLGILVTIDGRTIPFAPLLKALTTGRKRMRLADGAYFSLAHPALSDLRDLLAEAAELSEWETGPRIARTHLALWSDFEDLADESEPARSWRALLEDLRSLETIGATPLPAGLRAHLRPYQRAGFEWLAFLWRHGLGGILADDMGLGKTVQTLALLAHARESEKERPFLVVAPTSVLPSWREQAVRFAPGLRVREVGETSARRGCDLAELAAGADVVVTSYAVLRLDAAEFENLEWAGVVLDEAQAVKNPGTRIHQAVAALRARSTIALTGTPLENGLGDLWALLSLTAPGLFPSARRFRDEYVQPIEKGGVEENAEGGAHRSERLKHLRRRIRPFVLRRTKELVAHDLPEKQEQELLVELGPAHRELYDTVLHRERQKVLGLLDDLDRQRFIVFRSLTLLRMLSLAPELVDESHRDIGSAKIDALVGRLAELADEGHRALVFSQFTSFLDLVERRLAAAGIRHTRLDGSTTRRGEVVDDFRAGDAPVFLLSLKAGGVGLTLTEADYVFVLDPWWSPAAEAQAIDRAHRIGQQRHVFVYRMLSAGTIEEKVRALQRRKAALFRAVLDDGEDFAKALTAEDLRELFAG